MSCPSIDRLADYGDGRLAPPERKAVQEHAADCVACRLALSEMGRSSQRIAPPAAGDVAEPPHGGDTVLERYQLRKRIGAGAMGVVYIAHDNQLDRAVALKILYQRSADDGTAAIDEARALARIRHPNVVTVFDAAPHGGRLCIVMECVDGTTLRSWLAVRPHHWRRILQLFVDAGRGLAAAHAAGIAHGDFKPENVLVNRDGRVQVTDFGLARPARTAADGARTLSGTPVYMAPEQLDGAPADARTDQFAFCVALYEALLGRRPFVAGDVGDLRRRIQLGTPALSSERRLPRAVTRALGRGLAADPQARFPSMEALLAALESWPRRRQLAGGTIALLVLSLLVVRAFRFEKPPQNRLCRGDSRRAGATLNEQRRAARATATTGAHALDDADAALEAYVRRWVTARVGACEDADATAATDPVTRARYDERIRCFDDLRRRTEAAISHAFHAPTESDGVAALPAPETCLAR